MENNIAFPITGSVAGAGIYSTIGGVGLVGGFGGIGIGSVGMTAAGTVVGFAVYGAVEGIGNGDSAALIAMGLGAVRGATFASTIGGVGVSFGGSAFSIGLGSMTVAGGVFGLGIYGLAKMYANSETKEPIAETFNHMEDKISYLDDYYQAMVELNPLFAEFACKQQFADLEIEDEMEMLKAQMQSNFHNFAEFDPVIEPKSVEIELQEKFSWQLVRTISGHTNSINSFAIKDNILASASDDHNINLWDIERGKKIYSFFGSQEVQSVAINNKSIVGGGFDHAITSWKLSDKNLERIISKYRNPSSHQNVIYALIYNNKGDLLISGSADQTIKIWNYVTGSLKFTLSGHTASVRTLAISPCDRFLISGSADRTIRIWDLTTPFAKPHVIDQNSREIAAVAITPNGKYFISAAKDNCLKIWCMKTRKNIYTYESNIDNINSIAISSDNKILAVGNIDGTVEFWNLETTELQQTIDASSPVIFSENGKYLITGDIHNRIKIWQKMVGNSQSNHDHHLNAKWWKILSVSRNSSAIDIKTAYYNLAKKYHPDVNSTEEAKQMMSIINRAYQEAQIKYM
ncbi:MAG: DnaJ domain-containing protein [Waterburya sp.]